MRPAPPRAAARAPCAAPRARHAPRRTGWRPGTAAGESGCAPAWTPAGGGGAGGEQGGTHSEHALLFSRTPAALLPQYPTPPPAPPHCPARYLRPRKLQDGQRLAQCLQPVGAVQRLHPRALAGCRCGRDRQRRAAAEQVTCLPADVCCPARALPPSSPSRPAPAISSAMRLAASSSCSGGTTSSTSPSLRAAASLMGVLRGGSTGRRGEGEARHGNTAGPHLPGWPLGPPGRGTASLSPASNTPAPRPSPPHPSTATPPPDT